MLQDKQIPATMLPTPIRVSHPPENTHSIPEIATHSEIKNANTFMSLTNLEVLHE